VNGALLNVTRSKNAAVGVRHRETHHKVRFITAQYDSTFLYTRIKHLIVADGYILYSDYRQKLDLPPLVISVSQDITYADDYRTPCQKELGRLLRLLSQVSDHTSNAIKRTFSLP
jgi:hypothetical protein